MYILIIMMYVKAVNLQLATADLGHEFQTKVA